MKIKYAIAASLLLSISAFAQKEELRALKRISDKETPPTAAEITEFKRLVAAVEPKMGAATAEQQIEFHYFKAEAGMLEMMANPMGAQAILPKAIESLDKVMELEKAAGKSKYTKEIQTEIYPVLKNQLITAANQLNRQKMYKPASDLFLTVYKITKDPNYLYNAAVMSVNAQDYDTALKHYEELDKSGYTGEGISYTAKNVASGQYETFPDKKTRDLGLAQKIYVLPKDEKLPSLKGDIVKNIALIYVQKGDTEKAKQAMTAARKNNPDDVSLLIAEADLYLKTKDMATYKKLITEATQKNPNNADLYYNLGVVTSETDKAEAKALYEKALSINPNYTNANINLGIMMLDGEQKIVDEMNNPKTSDKRYNELKKQRDDLYKKALSYFDKAHKAEPDNQYVISSMVSMYQGLDMEAEAKAMKAKLKK